MVKTLAKRAMTTSAQKACYVIDHLVEALGNDPSSSLRRAMILCDIDQNPGTSQAQIMERINVHKSALNREIEWLFNYGCILVQPSSTDARLKEYHVCGYSKKGLDSALDYFDGDHEKMQVYLAGLMKVLRMEKPTLRDAKIVTALFEKGKATKPQIMECLYHGVSTTDHRSYNRFLDTGIIEEAAHV